MPKNPALTDCTVIMMLLLVLFAPKKYVFPKFPNTFRSPDVCISKKMSKPSQLTVQYHFVHFCTVSTSLIPWEQHKPLEVFAWQTLWHIVKGCQGRTRIYSRFLLKIWYQAAYIPSTKLQKSKLNSPHCSPPSKLQKSYSFVPFCPLMYFTYKSQSAYFQKIQAWFVSL